MRRFLPIFAAFLLLFACSKDEEEKTDVPTGPETLSYRISISADALSTEGASLGWGLPTSIRIFDKAGPGLLLTKESAGVYKIELNAAEIPESQVVFSPGTVEASYDGKQVHYAYPAEQTAMTGMLPEILAPAISSGAGKAQTLHPLFGGILFRPGRDDIHTVTFRGNGGERIAGKAVVGPDTRLVELTDDVLAVTLRTSVGVMDSDKDWLLVLPPVYLPHGYTLEVEALGGSYTVVNESPLEIAPGQFWRRSIPDDYMAPAPEYIPIPDPNFKAYLLEHYDTDGDGEISAAEAASVTKIEVTTHEIASLEGVRYFTNLETLVANGSRASDRTILGQLTSLDLRGLTHLQSVSCRHNYIEPLTLGENQSLTSIVCYGNSLTSLDLSGAPRLTSLDCGDAQIASINVSGNSFLSTLYVHNNRLTKLDLSGNPNLTTLRCDQNQIAELDLSKNTRLSSLDCAPMESLLRIYLSTGTVIDKVTVNRSADNIPAGTQIVYVDAPQGQTLGTGLRSVFINTPNGVGITSKETWVEKCTMRIVDDAGTVYYENELVSVKGRGNSTWSYDKKPYALKLPEKADLIGKGSSKRYVLLANWMDRTLLRNDVAFEIARRTGLEWTPSGEFVELFLNGTHYGNYWLGEKIKSEKSRLQSDYIIEMDTYYDATWRWYSSYGRRVNQGKNGLPIGVKEPDDDEMTQEKFEALKSLLNTAEEAIYLGNADYRTLIDVPTFIDWYLVHEVTYNGEPNHPKSCYFYFRGGVLYAGPVWDFDWYTFQPNTSGLFIKNSIYFGKLFEDPTFVSELKARWQELRSTFLSVTDYIDAKAAEIRASDAINIAMWPCTSGVNGDNYLSFDEAITRMKKGLTTRISAMDKAINAL